MPSDQSGLQRIGDVSISQHVQNLLHNDIFTKNDNWCVIYDLSLLEARFESLIKTFPADTLHTLAIKACPLISILKIAVNNGLGLEAASLEEVHLALAAGCDTSKILFDSPVKTADEIQFALQKGICINADNFDELVLIDDLFFTSCKSRIGLRINPEIGKGSISMTSVAEVASKFGVSLSENQSEIITAYQNYDWLNGIHIHIGSQACNLDQLVAAATKLEALVLQIEQSTKTKLIEWIDIGGGIPADYGFNIKGINLEDYAHALATKTAILYSRHLVTEFGRSLLANTAFALSRIEYLKTYNQFYTAAIHFGADFMLRPVYVADDWPHQYLVLEKDGTICHNESVNLSIAGPLCFSGDFLVRNQNMPKPQKNGLIVVKDVGAYTLGSWSRHCSRRLPKVLGFKRQDDNIYFQTLFSGESLEDVVEFWS